MPFVSAGGCGPLPADVPHRLLAWGVLHLPAVSPSRRFSTCAAAFPTAADDEWNQIGVVNGSMPAAAYSTLSVTRDGTAPPLA